jgi:hypothetical protein
MHFGEMRFANGIGKKKLLRKLYEHSRKMQSLKVPSGFESAWHDPE